ncbi:MAG: hypothetical protein M3N29_09305 [Chloroflexota bacterium]|nr:hypothetical protein [Chloroflexota bacterium]
MTNLVLWAAGFGLLALAVWFGRRPYSRMAELDRLAENARRYDSWRGGQATATNGPTGADVMRAMLRRRVLLWLVVGVVGVALIVAGFAVR